MSSANQQERKAISVFAVVQIPVSCHSESLAAASFPSVDADWSVTTPTSITCHFQEKVPNFYNPEGIFYDALINVLNVI